MILKKIKIVSMGIILCVTSLAQSHDYRQMQRQQNRVASNQQRYVDRNYQQNAESFQFSPRFNPTSTNSKLLLLLMIGAVLVDGAEAVSNAPPSIQNRHLTNRERATQSGLSKVFCPENQECIQLYDKNVRFTGTEKQVDVYINRLGDFSSIREEVIPVSRDAWKTQAHPNSKFNNFTDVLVSFGVDPESLKNMAVFDGADCGDSDMQFCHKKGSNHFIAINYKGLENGAKSFNQKTADSFLETFKSESLFFKFLTNTNKDIVTHSSGYILLNYGVFNEYFSLLNPEKICQSEGVHSVDIPLDTIIKRLMAAVSGEISLEESTTPGKFHVRTVTLGDTRPSDEKKAVPSVMDIIIDRSGSMKGHPIDMINSWIPILLNNLRNTMQQGDFLKINIFALDDTFSLHQSFLLERGLNKQEWVNMRIGGMTDLTPIGRQLKIEDGENPNKVVLAFTDGDHNSVSNLLDSVYFKKLKELQNSGVFARPFLCKVGEGSDNFFKEVASIFSGSYSKENNIADFIERVSRDIPSLLESKKPFVLSINGHNKVIWHGDANPGMQTTTETIGNNDFIIQGEFKAIVDVPPVETKEQKKTRLVAELRALDDL